VNLVFKIRYLLSALAILGLILSPVAMPAMAMPAMAMPAMAMPAMAMPAMAMPGDMHAAKSEHAPAINHHAMAMHDEASAMSPDMPCCPKKIPSRDCGKECALMAMCANLILQIPTSGAWLLFPMALVGQVASRNDAPRDSLAQAPPPRPPRT
jgi:hypothetical protein